MPYCALSDITARTPEQNIIQLTDDAGNGVVDEEKVDQAIADASDLIDGYLRGRYNLPLDSVPGVISKLSVDLAIYNLFARKMDIEMPKPVSDRYGNAVKLLTQIQTGVISLGIEAEAEPPGGGIFKTNKTKGSRTFPDDELDTF